MKYITYDGRYSNLHLVHFKLLSHLQHGRRVNVPNFLYHLISISAKETQRGGNHSISHHSLIKLLVEHSLRDVSQMAWGAFEDILQFREENAHDAEEIAAQEKDIGEPSSPRVSAENEPHVANEAFPIAEEMVIETNIEDLSTHFQSGATSSRRKGKEIETIDTKEEIVEQPQAVQVSPAAKRCKVKENSPTATPPPETSPTDTLKMYSRRSRRGKQKTKAARDVIEVIFVETSEEGHKSQTEIQPQE